MKNPILHIVRGLQLMTGILLLQSSFGQSDNPESERLIPQEPTVYEDAITYQDEATTQETVYEFVFDSLRTNPPAEMTHRALPAKKVKALKEDPRFFYVKEGVPKATRSEGFRIHRFWLYLIFILFIGLLLWYLKVNGLVIFRKKSSRLGSEDGDQAPEDLFSIDYSSAVQEALKSGNYRQAVRLKYLELLKEMTHRNIIQYQPEKTNFDYLQQLRSGSYYDAFFTVTRNYEYAWYGLFDIDAHQYHQIESAFTRMKNLFH
ncbi:hypothetical protein GCM10027051_01560 [Niabella terrae]